GIQRESENDLWESSRAPVQSRPGRLLLMEDSPTSAPGTGWERTPWYATQRGVGGAEEGEAGERHQRHVGTLDRLPALRGVRRWAGPRAQEQQVEAVLLCRALPA